MKKHPTERGLQVLAHLADGCSNKVIGARLGISGLTVKNHVRVLFRKMRARNRTHAVTQGYRLGYLKVPEENKVPVAQIPAVPVADDPPRTVQGFEDIRFYSGNRVTIGSRSLELNKIGYKLLWFLIENSHAWKERGYILDKVWGNDVYVEERTVDVHVCRLRTYLAGTPYWIECIRNSGYHFVRRQQS